MFHATTTREYRWVTRAPIEECTSIDLWPVLAYCIASNIGQWMISTTADDAVRLCSTVGPKA